MEVPARWRSGSRAESRKLHELFHETLVLNMRIDLILCTVCDEYIARDESVNLPKYLKICTTHWSKCLKNKRPFYDLINVNLAKLKAHVETLYSSSNLKSIKLCDLDEYFSYKGDHQSNVSPYCKNVKLRTGLMCCLRHCSYFAVNREDQSDTAERDLERHAQVHASELNPGFFASQGLPVMLQDLGEDIGYVMLGDKDMNIQHQERDDADIFPLPLSPLEPPEHSRKLILNKLQDVIYCQQCDRYISRKSHHTAKEYLDNVILHFEQMISHNPLTDGEMKKLEIFFKTHFGFRLQVPLMKHPPRTLVRGRGKKLLYKQKNRILHGWCCSSEDCQFFCGRKDRNEVKSHKCRHKEKRTKHKVKLVPVLYSNVHSGLTLVHCKGDGVLKKQAADDKNLISWDIGTKGADTAVPVKQTYVPTQLKRKLPSPPPVSQLKRKPPIPPVPLLPLKRKLPSPPPPSPQLKRKPPIPPIPPVPQRERKLPVPPEPPRILKRPKIRKMPSQTSLPPSPTTKNEFRPSPKQRSAMLPAPLLTPLKPNELVTAGKKSISKSKTKQIVSSMKRSTSSSSSALKADKPKKEAKKVVRFEASEATPITALGHWPGWPIRTISCKINGVAQ